MGSILKRGLVWILLAYSFVATGCQREALQKGPHVCFDRQCVSVEIALKSNEIKLGLMYANFGPQDPRLTPVWEYAAKHHLPVMMHTGTTFIENAPLEHTMPRLIEPVAWK